MSKYTTELRWICETSVNHPISGKGYNKIEEIITASRGNIFDFDYPIFDADYKLILEKKILRHFYTREICEETVGLWKLRLCDKMNVIMPYYNQLYNSALLQFDPFADVDYTRTGERSGTTSDVSIGSVNSDEARSKTADDLRVRETKTSTERAETGESAQANVSVSNSSGTDTTSAEGWSLYSDTPQGTVSNLDNNAYLTNATKTTNENTAGQNRTENSSDNTTSSLSNSLTATDDTTGSETGQKNENENKNRTETNTKSTDKNDFSDYTERIFGKRNNKSYSQLLDEFRKTFLNIDAMILKDLEPLFFGLW